MKNDNYFVEELICVNCGKHDFCIIPDSEAASNGGLCIDCVLLEFKNTVPTIDEKVKLINTRVATKDGRLFSNAFITDYDSEKDVYTLISDYGNLYKLSPNELKIKKSINFQICIVKSLSRLRQTITAQSY